MQPATGCSEDIKITAMHRHRNRICDRVQVARPPIGNAASSQDEADDMELAIEEPVSNPKLIPDNVSTSSGSGSSAEWSGNGRRSHPNLQKWWSTGARTVPFFFLKTKAPPEPTSFSLPGLLPT